MHICRKYREPTKIMETYQNHGSGSKTGKEEGQTKRKYLPGTLGAIREHYWL